MRKLACLVALALVGCGPHGISDGTLPGLAIKPEPPRLANVRVGDTACFLYWYVSKDGHVWLAPWGEVTHFGACRFWDWEHWATITHLESGWKMEWRGKPAELLDYTDNTLRATGYEPVTELEW